MGVLAIAGHSNSGKSTSLRYLDPKETFIINVNNKQLPIPGFKKNYTKFRKEPVLDEKGNPVIGENGKPKIKWVGNYYQSNSYDKIEKVLGIVKRMPFKYVVCDDINYLIGYDTMSMATTASYDKYSLFAANYDCIMNTLFNMRDDQDVIIISHLENEGTDNKPSWCMLSISKMLKRTCPIDGRFNYILYAERIVDDLNEKVTYKFRTRTKGNDTCRSTAGCFKEMYIEPNVKKALERINAFELGDEEPEYPEDDSMSIDNKSNKEKPAEQQEEKSSNDNDEIDI